jgi:hypothetical protein
MGNGSFLGYLATLFGVTVGLVVVAFWLMAR